LFVALSLNPNMETKDSELFKPDEIQSLIRTRCK